MYCYEIGDFVQGLISTPPVVCNLPPVLTNIHRTNIDYLSDKFNRTSKLSGQCDLLCTIDDKFNKPMGLGVVKDHLIIANSCEHSVVVYDRKGNYIAYLRADCKYNMPTVISSWENENGETEILVKDETQIYVFDMKFQFKKRFGKGDLRKMPCGIMIVKGFLYLVFRLKATFCNFILIHFRSNFGD